MYNTDFDIKRARYVVILKSNYYKYKNGINTWNNQEYMESVYGVYAYSFEDILIFLEKELITYFSKNNLLGKGIKDRKEELYRYYKNFKIYDLKDEIYIGEEYYNYNRNHFSNHFSDLRDYKLFNYNSFLNSTLMYTSKSYDLITKVAEWNGISYKPNYLYPVLKIDKEYSCQGKRQYRKRFHGRSRNYLILNKKETIAGSDPENRQYLSMRQRNREHSLNYVGLRNNRNNVPGDWKHYNKCRKQWAKNIDNPSYEKLSKAVWKYEVEEKKNIDMNEKYCVVNDASEILYEADTEDEAREWIMENYEPDLQIIFG